MQMSLCTQMHKHVRCSRTREQSILALCLNPDLNINYVRQHRCLRFEMWGNTVPQAFRNKSYIKVHGLKNALIGSLAIKNNNNNIKIK